MNRLAVSAANHRFTGCVIGEVLGMVIATALGRRRLDRPVNRAMIARRKGHAAVHDQP